MSANFHFLAKKNEHFQWLFILLALERKTTTIFIKLCAQQFVVKEEEKKRKKKSKEFLSCDERNRNVRRNQKMT